MISQTSEELSAPDFLKYRGKSFTKVFSVVRKTVDHSKIATVCEEANCPNRTECWSGGTATFMLMGDTCTRGCKFCSVKTALKPQPLDPKEPENLVKALNDWELNYIVLTSVDRDDLPDGGATHLAKCIRAVKSAYPSLKVEILIPDFQGKNKDILKIIKAKPDVIAHNIETIRRLTPIIRDRRATYDQSLKVLKVIKQYDMRIFTKSSIMVGFSENPEEVRIVMSDLRSIGVDFLTIGQYMRPSLKKLPVKKYLSLEDFKEYKSMGEEMGFTYVASAPLVRSSYKAGEFFAANVNDKKA